MEKRSPHYLLATIKLLVADAATRRITRSALEGASAVGIDRLGVVAAVLALKPGNFYKSMTIHSDSRTWQDVYHTTHSGVLLYLKLQVVEGVGVIISFKEL
jgi:motility quorum-sensing regulator / GCU-specific mRNA interferase toxin